VNGASVKDPKAIVEYLCAAKVNGLYVTRDTDVVSTIQKILNGEEIEGCTGRKLGKIKIQLTWEMALPIYTMTKAGISVGSIVEGVDWGTEDHVLNYPFSEKAFWEAVERVEQEASDIWNETHGCPKCGPVGGTGYRAINPKCKSCKGHGIII
jgi:hypothetical protein